MSLTFKRFNMGKVMVFLVSFCQRSPLVRFLCRFTVYHVWQLRDFFLSVSMSWLLFPRFARQNTHPDLGHVKTHTTNSRWLFHGEETSGCPKVVRKFSEQVSVARLEKDTVDGSEIRPTTCKYWDDTWYVKKPCKWWDRLPTSTGDRRISSINVSP